MTKRTRGNHTAAFQAKVALAAVKGEKTLAGLTSCFDFHPNQITNGKAQFLHGGAGREQSARPKLGRVMLGEKSLVRAQSPPVARFSMADMVAATRG
jgi:transposase